MANSIRSLIALALLAAPVAAQNPNVVLFTGVVVDSAKRPLENAEILFPGLAKSATTNDKGGFRFGDIPFGSHRVIVRRIGYGQMDSLFNFEPQQNVEWRVTLGRIVTLDSVIVSEPVDPLMAEFAENRARGFGRFLTRADLEKRENQTVGAVIRSLAGVGLVQGNGGQNWVASKRAPTTSCRGINDRVLSIPPDVRGRAGQEYYDKLVAETEACVRRERIYYVPEQGEKHSGVALSCYAQVYQDRTLMNFGLPTMPFDVNALDVRRIEAIEWYESPSQTPAKYSVQNAKCGVLVIHTRRDGKK